MDDTKKFFSFTGSRLKVPFPFDLAKLAVNGLGELDATRVKDKDNKNKTNNEKQISR